ncbi:MAG TPA: hypothetical protein VKE95_21515 [Burkholderiales bacterium]|nr:hypothetical protein [Burkholderiales bacterium]
MHYPTLIKRLMASGFVLVGGITIVLMIWPEGITDLAAEDMTASTVARAIGAVAVAAFGVMVLLTLWDE